MATSTANGTAGHAIVGDGSVTAQELEDSVENMVIGDLSRDHAASGSSVPAIGTTAPTTSLVTGEVWVDPTDPLDTGTTKTHVLKTYNGSAFRPGVVAWHIDNGDGAAPTYTAGRGMGWYDSLLKIFRVYSTINGVSDWHPIDRGLVSMENNHASITCPAGGVVVSDNQVGDPTAAFGGAFTLTTTKKDRSVIGVALESIAAGSRGVIALIGSGMEVEILCDNDSGDATVAAGDYLASYSTAGEARGVGAQIADPNIDVAGIAEGTPMGAFAVALEAKDGTTHLARSRLLGFIGHGQWRYISPTKVAQASDFSDGTWNEIDMISPDQGSSILSDADHAPIFAVGLDFEGGENTQDGGDAHLLLEVGPNRTNVRRLVMASKGASGAVDKQLMTWSIIVPTKSNNADSFASAGNVIQVRPTETSQNFDQLDVFAHKYLY